MPGHDLIVVGGSAGGVEALAALVAGLPHDLPAAVCAVTHMRPYGESHLAQVLATNAAVRVVAAEHGMPLEPGTVYVAVPDLHLLVERAEDGGTLGAVLRLTRGPRENRNRPAVDPLFRSAALAFGPRVIGVVLSGALDDGTAGLWTIRDRGGLAVVQDPADARIPSMPRSALDEVGADHVAPATALGALLGRLARESSDHATPPASDELTREVAMSSVDESVHQRLERYGVPSRFVCPDCGGVLWDVSGHGPLRYRCETGHAFSAASLDEQQTQAVEDALWAALRAIEDKVAFARVRADRARTAGLVRMAERFQVQEDAAQQHASTIRAQLRLDGSGGIRPRETRAEDDAA